jgi:hypothetical protein
MCAVFVLALSALPLAGQADILLEGFEGSIHGSVLNGTLSYETSVGVTEGNSSAAITMPNSWYELSFVLDQSELPSLGYTIKMSDSKTLLLDVTGPAPSFEGGWGGNVWLNIQGDGLAWTDLAALDARGTDQTTFSFDYSGVDLSAVPENPSWFQVHFLTAFGGPDGWVQPGPVYIDNLRLEGGLIPEPSSIGLFGLGALLLAGRVRARLRK